MITAEQARALAPKEDSDLVEGAVQKIMEKVVDASASGSLEVNVYRPRSEIVRDFVRVRLESAGYDIDDTYSYGYWIISWRPRKEAVYLPLPEEMNVAAPKRTLWSRLWSRD